jgi:hypothetical protein
MLLGEPERQADFGRATGRRGQATRSSARRFDHSPVTNCAATPWTQASKLSTSVANSIRCNKPSGGGGIRPELVTQVPKGVDIKLDEMHPIRHSQTAEQKFSGPHAGCKASRYRKTAPRAGSRSPGKSK